MSHLHERGAEEFESLGMSYMLDRVPLDMYQKMVDQPGCDRGSTQRPRRSGTTEAVALPRMQPAKR